MRELGIAKSVAKALEIAGDGTDSIYPTVDIDVVDSATAPGTGHTNFDGLTSGEFLQTLKARSESPRIGGIDLVEVTPPFDHRGITAYLAASGLVEFLTPRILDGR